jgi:hypothetical protein
VGPKERERRLAEQRVDRSHRRRGGIRGRRRPPSWTRKKDELVLSLALLFAPEELNVIITLAKTENHLNSRLKAPRCWRSCDNDHAMGPVALAA